jgi:hypothetical protein
VQHDRPRRQADRYFTERRRRPSKVASQPDRIALWAVVMALVAMLAAAATSAHGSGGVGSGQSSGDGGGACADQEFGKRNLSLGDCGPDVRTLNWILKSKKFARSVALHRNFDDPTDTSVRTFQRRKDLRPSGVVNPRTRTRLVRSMRKDRATWYGPGFYGNRTACGQRLRRKTVGVAHKRLPCGTKVTFRYKGRFLRTKVIDRGPYAHGARWDLTNGARKKLGFAYTDNVRAAVIR